MPFDISNLTDIIFSVVSVLIALSIHEFAHALAADLLGDHTAKNLGRLTVNPLRHLDFMGAICMLLFRFGWAKPVPINPRNFKRPKLGFAVTAIAGPLANILLAFFSIPIYLLCVRILPSVPEGFLFSLVYNTALFFATFSSLNIGLGVFNLLPIPPFDGSRILNVILPAKLYFKIMKYERYIYWGVVIWLLGGHYVYRAICMIPFFGSNPILVNAFKFLDLSGLIGIAINAILDGMLFLWQLLPFL